MTYSKRIIRLVGEQQRETAINAIRNAPILTDKPLEIIIREEQKARTPDANARMWAGPLRDMEEQAWMSGRQYSAEIWHEHAKREFLPEADHPDLAKLVKYSENWRKWDIDMRGERVCVGSTTQLTAYGMSQHCMQIEALGGSLGVMFHESPRRHALPRRTGAAGGIIGESEWNDWLGLAPTKGM